MRLAAFFIFVYVVVGIQIGLAGPASIRGIGPNLLLPAVVFLSLHLSRRQAVTGSIILGLAQDLTTLQPPGLFAAAYGISAVLITRAAEGVRRGHVLTWVAMTVLGGMVTGTLLLLHDMLRGSADGARIGPRVVAVTVIYSAAVSPVVIGLLRGALKWTRLDVGRRGHRV